MSEGPAVEVPLDLKYDGPEYQGEMSARELAGVLESLADFVQAVEAADALAGQRGAKVKVKAFDEGSFEIEAVVEIAKSIGANGGNVAAIIAAVMAAFRFYWQNMRRRVKNAEFNPERQRWMVTLIDGTSQEWTEEQWRLYNSKVAPRAMRGLVAPLERGATRLEIGHGSERIKVPAERVADFTLPDPELPPPPARMEVMAWPDTISFDPDKMWRLVSRELKGFRATIEDKQFLEGVALGRIRVGKNDTFRLAMRVEYGGDDAKPNRYFVERVIDHHPGAEQDALPSEGEE